MGPVSAASSGPSADWREVEGPEGQVIGDHGRLFDLIVIARTTEQALIDWQVMCEAAFFESGRPTLIAAPEVPGFIGSKVLIHWNGSTEAARTLSFARPFLEEAESVTVLSVTEAMVPGPTGEGVAAHLRRAGIDAEAFSAECAGRSPGEVITKRRRRGQATCSSRARTRTAGCASSSSAGRRARCSPAP